MSQPSPLRPAGLFRTGSASQRASPFQRPTSPSVRTPSTVRGGTPTQTSPLKSSITPALDAQQPSSPTQRPSSPSPSPSRPTYRSRESTSTAGTVTQSSFASRINTMPSATATNTASKRNDPLSNIPAHQLHSMRESFAVLDRSNSGTVTAPDVADMLSQLGLDSSPSALAAFFPAPSAAGGGVATLPGGGINLATYLNTLAASLAPLSDPQELLAAFSTFDDDDSGQVAVDELREALLSTPPELGAQRMTAREIDGVLDGFSGRRAFSKGMVGRGDVKRDDVFKYREFVAGVTGGAGPSANGNAEVKT